MATLITSMGLLALAGMMGAGLRYSRTSEFRSAAALLAADIADRMRANLSGTASYVLTPAALATTAPTALSTCSVATACTPAEMATIDLETWRRTLFNSLPNGTGYVSVSDASSRMVDIWVMWTDPAALSGSSGNQWGNYVNAGLDGRTCPPGFNNLDPLPRCMFFRVGL